jgi:predicted MFS family arabinose efflux permease
VVIILFYAVSFCLTLGVYRAPARPDSLRFTPWRDLVEGIAHVWTTPSAVSAMALAFLVNLTAFPLTQGLLPYVAREVYRIDQQGLGFLVASFACGSLAGSVALSLGGRSIRPARMMLVSILVWYALLLVFALRSDMAGGMVLLVLAGFAQSLGMVPMSVILLRASDERLRGRVMGVRMLAVYGLPLGLLTAGALIGRLGFAAAIALYCVAGIGFTLAIAIRWRADLWRVQGSANVR